MNLFNEIKDVLIVNELNVAPIDLFFCVFFLFHLKDMLRKGKIGHPFQKSEQVISAQMVQYELQRNRKYLVKPD